MPVINIYKEHGIGNKAQKGSEKKTIETKARTLSTHTKFTIVF